MWGGSCRVSPTPIGRGATGPESPTSWFSRYLAAPRLTVVGPNKSSLSRINPVRVAAASDVPQSALSAGRLRGANPQHQR